MVRYPPRTGNDDSSWGLLSGIMGFSFVASLAQGGLMGDSVRFFIIGTLIEAGRRLFQWLMERYKFQYCITAEFTEGDPSYEWVAHLLTQENVWRRSRHFRVNEKNSKRKWGLKLGPEVDGHADYVPTYKEPQIFRWKGYWIEIKRSQDTRISHPPGSHAASTIFMSFYTLDMHVLYKFVEEARVRYKEVSMPHVIVYMADMPTYGPNFVWSNVKRKTRRPLSSIILMEGVVDSLVKDVQEFIGTEQWYVEAGIPHRRGYLLHGPPGTGKTSTIYALAGELGLEIYALSLASGFVDDAFLQKASAAIPKNSILLIEDIDCATSREDVDDGRPNHQPIGFVGPNAGPVYPRTSLVTLSGLLNVLDGVGSEEGKLFFATTNHIDRLDAALVRPGRIDMKIQYKLATKPQASALFLRFFDRPLPSSSSTPEAPAVDKPDGIAVADLAAQFTSHIPEHTFSIAELQGFLLSCKRDSKQAADGIAEWVVGQLQERSEKQTREEDRKREAQRKRDERERRQVEGAVATIGNMVGGGFGKMVLGGGGGMVTGGAVPLPSVISPPSTPSPAYEEKKDVAESSLTVPVNPIITPATSSAL